MVVIDEQDRIKFIERYGREPKLSDQMKGLLDRQVRHQKAFTVSQIEAWFFVKRINLNDLWSQPIGLGRDVFQSMDWVGRMLPPVPAIYFVCVEDVTGIMPIYIGMTKVGLDRRIGQHHGVVLKAALNYSKEYLCLRYIPLSDAMDISSIESAAISWWNPPLNIQRSFPGRDDVEIYIQEMKSILGCD